MKIKGKAYWAKIRTPETYNGQPVGFSMQVLMQRRICRQEDVR